MNFYAAIGLPIRTHTDFTDYLEQLVDDGEIQPTFLGMYIRWPTYHGAELWAQIADNGEILHVAPFFAGRGRINARLIQRHDNDSTLAGIFEATLQEESAPEQSIWFDCPMYALNDDLPLPAHYPIQATLLAQTVMLFPDVEAVLAVSTPSRFPAITPVDDPALHYPHPVAIVTGTILKAALLNNPIGNASFWWLLVQTLGGTLDVVCEPELIASSPLSGGLIHCLGQLSGAIIR